MDQQLSPWSVIKSSVALVDDKEQSSSPSATDLSPRPPHRSDRSPTTMEPQELFEDEIIASDKKQLQFAPAVDPDSEARYHARRLLERVDSVTRLRGGRASSRSPPIDGDEESASSPVSPYNASCRPIAVAEPLVNRFWFGGRRGQVVDQRGHQPPPEGIITATVVKRRQSSIFLETFKEALWHRRRRRWVTLASAFLVVIGLSVLLGLLVPNEKEQEQTTPHPSPTVARQPTMGTPTTSSSSEPTSSSTKVPTSSPITAVREIFDRFLLEVDATIGSLELEEPSDSTRLPAYRALQWLQNDDPLRESSECSVTTLVQRYALATLHFATANPPFFETDLVEASSECEWELIDCDRHGQVILVDVTRNNSTGSIPPEMGLLTNLRELRMWQNRLTGTLPDSLELLAPHLSSLQLAGNQFDPSPLPEWLFELTQLEYLSLGYNSFQGPLPTEIGRLTALRALELEHMKYLTGPIPSELYGLTHLTAVDLRGNRLDGSLSTELSSLSKLTSLLLGDNNFVGSLPKFLGNSLTLLARFDVNYNHMTGTLPSEFGLWTYLQQFDITANQFEGTIPTELSLWTALSNALSLGLNDLTGTIPTEFGRFQKLRRSLDLHENNLIGPIPTELGQLSLLEGTILLDGNQLEGTIPSEFGRLERLGRLGLGHNPALGGALPTEVGQMGSLMTLELSNVNVQGPIPTQVCDGLVNVVQLTVNCDVECRCCTEYCF